MFKRIIKAIVKLFERKLKLKFKAFSFLYQYVAQHLLLLKIELS